VSTAAEAGARLVLPLRRLHAVPEPSTTVAPRRLDLDERPAPAVAAWATQVRASREAAVLVDATGRVVALSDEAARQWGVGADAAVGVRLLDLLTVVDFTEGAVALADAEMHVPPLRALFSGRMARGLVRVRTGAGALATYDVVGVPLESGVGAVGFVQLV
jgi:PAS domain-containing protein